MSDQIPDIEFELPERETKGFLRRQRGLMSVYSRYTRAAANVAKLQGQTDVDGIAIADALDEVISAQDTLVELLAQYVTRPEEKQAKADALLDLSQDEYEAITQAILNPERIGEGADQAENPTPDEAPTLEGTTANE